MDVEVTVQAQFDMRAASRFYERERAGLGREFLTAATEDLTRLGRLAGIHARWANGAHHMAMRRFPFAFFYLVDDGIAVVVAVLHYRRDPGMALRRIAAWGAKRS